MLGSSSPYLSLDPLACFDGLVRFEPNGKVYVRSESDGVEEHRLSRRDSRHLQHLPCVLEFVPDGSHQAVAIAAWVDDNAQDAIGPATSMLWIRHARTPNRHVPAST